MRIAPNVNLKLEHQTEDGKLITVQWVPGEYRQSNKGLATVKEGHWLPLLHIDAERTQVCRMPLGLLGQRLGEDKARQSKERKSADILQIIEEKRKNAEGMRIHV